MTFLAQPLTQVKGVGPFLAAKFAKLDIHTVKDLLYHFPFRYQDFSKISKIADVAEGETVVVFGVIEKLGVRKTWKRKMWLVEATVADESGHIKAIWFNQKYLAGVLKEGMSVNLAGKVVADERGRFVLSSPVYEIISRQQQETRHTARIVPVYPETKGITSKAIRLVLSKVIKQIAAVDEFMPPDILAQHRFPHIGEAFEQIHFPASFADADRALKRFAFQDLFLLQLLKANEKRRLAQHRALAVAYDPENIKQYFSYLPFQLTLSQKKALWEILEDLKKPHPTSRLLQGDVGSGKTVVAALAALNVAQQSFQTVFMAPTEVLAAQHFATFTKFFEEFSGGVALLTSSKSSAFWGRGLDTSCSKKDVLEQIRSGALRVIIGTHAVIQKHVQFDNVVFVVVDEQHRFGVSQRAQLASIRSHDLVPHFLSMSATPIPRTLALTVFGDLDLSVISELPHDRKPIVTKIVPPASRPAAYDFIRKQVHQGRQCYVICPRIDPTDTEGAPLSPRQWATLEVKSVKEEYEKLSQKVFGDLRVSMLHGRMASKEKHEVMSAFTSGSIDVLVSTSVVEVGIDVPNASIIMIEGSERFGLAQLYQFRGRVGRGEYQSYCFLLTESRSGTTRVRLKAILSAKSGFELAEVDLKLRGPGQFLGSEQTGMPDLAMKSLANPDLVVSAREEALKFLSHDPTLREYPYLAAYLKLFGQQVHIE